MVQKRNDFVAESKELVKSLRESGVDLPLEFAGTLAAYRRWEAYGAPGTRLPGEISLQASAEAGMKILEEEGKQFLQTMRD